MNFFQNNSDSLIKYKRFLLILSIAGGLAVYLATASLGAGLGADSAKYLSTAENIATGNGLYAYNGAPLTQWPPLYPLLLAGLHLLTRIDVFIIGWALNIIVFGALIWAGGLLMLRAFPNQMYLAVFGSVLLASSAPIISISANISTDPLFILIVIFFLLTSENYLRTNSRFALGLLAFLVIVASLLRYAGLSLVFTGGALVFFSMRDKPIKAIPAAIGFMFATSLPLLSWSIIQKYPNVDSLFGRHGPAVPLGNIDITVGKIFSWFIPTSVLNIAPPAYIAAAILILFISGNRRQDWIKWASRLSSSSVLPSAIFFAVYLYMLIFNTSYYEVRHFDRIHVVILPSFLVLGLTTFKVLLPKYLYKLPPNTLNNIILLGLLAFTVLPIYRVQKYVRATARHGDTNYNFVNSRDLRESELVAVLQSIQVEEGATIYSNNEAVAWFYLRQPVYKMPRTASSTIEDRELEISTNLDWPPEGETGLVVWFKSPLDYKPNLIPPDQAYRLGWLILLFESETGDVYELNRSYP